ncbi:MAG: lytic transglycosylase domain-containing protein [Actinobacteria bacterium]|jgi:hypothetical protein|nr:lytic transglycosylase domain-containing protein [Actinomycetota bacterium]MCL6104196.1 lytic transglycosylase domain-containing protein [Actinomycetota bacterium]
MKKYLKIIVFVIFPVIIIASCTAMLLMTLVIQQLAGQFVGSLGGVSTDIPDQLALTTIPSTYLDLYRQAAAGCKGLSWKVLAAIGTVESDNGKSYAPGVHSGTNYAGAEGPMQFEPGTFAAYATVGPGGAVPPNPYDPVDAIWSAARMLCVNGASNQSTLVKAVFAYNHSQSYVAKVLELAWRYS